MNYEAKWRRKHGQAGSSDTAPDVDGMHRKILKIQNYYFRLTREHSAKILSFMTRWVANHVAAPH